MAFRIYKDVGERYDRPIIKSLRNKTDGLIEDVVLKDVLKVVSNQLNFKTSRNRIWLVLIDQLG